MFLNSGKTQPHMKVALAQINPTVGGIEGNTKKIISIISKTKADIIAFPELSVTGYSPQDLILMPNFIRQNTESLKTIVKAVKNKVAIVGFIEKSDGHLYNSAAVIRDRKIIGVHHKICLPNYAVFDEKRWFKEGTNATVFEFKGEKIGLGICEDIWLPETSKKQKHKGAELIINISASPYRKGKFKVIENILEQRWGENKIPIIYVNQVGAQDGIVYCGHSTHFKDGKVAAKCRDFEEDILIVDIK